MSRSHWSIGEILSLLQDEFPEVTISKIRFLEGQGLIAPERTPSGYRRFYPADFEQLKWILTQQRDNYLPLRVIREQIRSGAVEFGSEEHDPAPEQATLGFAAPNPELVSMSEPEVPPKPEPTPKPKPAAKPEPTPKPKPARTVPPEPEASDEVSVALTREELALRAGCSSAMLSDLERHGFLEGHAIGPTTLYGRSDLAVVKLAVRFADHGLEPRHLRSFRLAAERQVGLFAQIIGPQLRRNNLEARKASLEALDDLNGLAETFHRLLVERNVAEQLPKHQ